MMERAARYSPLDYMCFLEFNDELRPFIYLLESVVVEARFKRFGFHQDLEHAMHGKQQKKR